MCKWHMCCLCTGLTMTSAASKGLEVKGSKWTDALTSEL